MKSKTRNLAYNDDNSRYKEPRRRIIYCNTLKLEKRIFEISNANIKMLH